MCGFWLNFAFKLCSNKVDTQTLKVIMETKILKRNLDVYHHTRHTPNPGLRLFTIDQQTELHQKNGNDIEHNNAAIGQEVHPYTQSKVNMSLKSTKCDSPEKHQKSSTKPFLIAVFLQCSQTTMRISPDYKKPLKAR